MIASLPSDSREFVQYVIAAVNANPDLREPLLRALLTEEFLEMPGRLARIEEDVNTLKNDVGRLRGKAHETDFARTATSLLNSEFGFRRIRVVQGNVIALPRYAEEFHEKALEATDDGLITDEQLRRIFATDVIAHCRRPGETEPTWVAVEVAARVDADDINRALLSAQALRLAFGEDALPVIAGERIDPPDAARLEQAGVAFIDISQRF